MALYPKAVKKLLTPDARDPLINPTVAVLHVDAGNATSLYGWWKQSGDLECHFFVKKDGVVEQYVDTKYQADAQVGGAAHGISIETQGYDAGTWTDAQLASIKDLLLWLHLTERIPLKVPANPYDSGVGYHSMFKSTVPGTWARDGRTCPGADRVKQYRNVLVPWMSEGGDDMPSAEEIAKAVWEYKVPRPNDTADAPAGNLLGGANVYAWRASKGVLDEAALAKSLAAAMPAGTTVTQEQLEAALRTVLGSLD